jgi:hypothetical protein
MMVDRADVAPTTTRRGRTMIAARRKVRSPLKTHGGKSYLARRFIALMPPSRAFAEHYAGGMSIGLNLEPPACHLANDLDPELMGFWRSLRAADGGTLDAIRGLAYSEATFRMALGRPGDPQAFLARNRMSRGALGKDFAWSERLRGKTRPGGPFPGDLNAWETIVEELSRELCHPRKKAYPLRLTASGRSSRPTIPR